jgi:hypothetical protein
MAVIRVPYPVDPDVRRRVFEHAAAALTPHGTYQGTPERGSFSASTPLGSFAGNYRFLEDSGELEIELTKKPWLMSTHMLEHEVRKILASA